MSEPAMTVELATCIINEMRSRKVIGTPLPEDPDERIKLASNIVAAAQREHASGNTNPDITVVMNLVKLGPADEALSAPSQAAPEPAEASTPTAPPEPAQEAPSAPQGVSETTDSEVVADIKQRVSGFPIPQMIPDPGPFPSDLTRLSMVEIRRAAGEWNRVFASALWNLGLEQSELMRAEQVHQGKRNRALKKVSRKDEDGKARLAAAIEADIASDGEVKEWHDRVVKHETYVNMFKGLVRIYEGNIDRLSREITARMAEDSSSKTAERK